MSGMKRQQSHTRKEPPKKLLAELAQAEAMVEYFRGKPRTIWHDIFDRLSVAKAWYDNQPEEIEQQELEEE